MYVRQYESPAHASASVQQESSAHDWHVPRSANFTWAQDNWIGNPPISGYHACFLEVLLRRPARGRVNGVALPPIPVTPPPAPTPGPAPGPVPGPGTGTAGGSVRGGDNANGNHEINDRCFGSTAARVASPLALLFGLLVFAVRRRS